MLRKIKAHHYLITEYFKQNNVNRTFLQYDVNYQLSIINYQLSQLSIIKATTICQFNYNY